MSFGVDKDKFYSMKQSVDVRRLLFAVSRVASVLFACVSFGRSVARSLAAASFDHYVIKYNDMKRLFF